MKNIAKLLSIISCVLFAQDDFFEPGYSIGGYGELHYNQSKISDEDPTIILDFHRFIIYYGYNWTEEWSFKSELELEHNFVSGSNGELELEQAYVNYHKENWGFQGGVILPTVGLINEYHEPPLFLSVERPDYNKYIIPTTWFGNGLSIYGNLGDFKLRLALLEDLKGEGILNDGHIRGGRGKGYKTTGYSFVKNMSAVYSGIKDLRIGGSLTLNNAPVNSVPDTSVSVKMMELNAKYYANNMYVLFEYGMNDFKGNNVHSMTDFKSSGYYLDLGYNIGEMVNTNKLIPWFRLSNVSTNVDIDSKIKDYKRFGITWWPIDNVAFKFDYGTITKKSDKDNPVTKINLGLGYNF